MNPILRRIREVVRETGMTQRALDELGVAPQQVLSRWMTVDNTEPSATSLAAVCEKLGINGHWLLTGQGQKYAARQGSDVAAAQGLALGLERVEDFVRRYQAALVAWQLGGQAGPVPTGPIEVDESAAAGDVDAELNAAIEDLKAREQKTTKRPQPHRKKRTG